MNPQKAPSPEIMPDPGRMAWPRRLMWLWTGAAALVVVAVVAGVVSFRRSSGSVEHTIALHVSFPLVMAIDNTAGRVYVSGGTPGQFTIVRLDIVDAAGGRLLSAVPVPIGLNPQFAPDGNDGHLFASSAAGTVLTMLDSSSGVAERTLPIAGAVTALLAQDGRLYAALVDTHARGTLAIFDAHTGASVRSARVGAYPTAMAYDRRSHHLFVFDAGDATVCMVDARSGAVLQVTPLHQRAGASVDSIPSLVIDERDERVFATASGSTTVAVLDARRGRLLRTTPAGPAPGPLTVDEHTQRAFVVNGWGDSVSVLDARSGALIRTVPVGAAPRDIVLDQQTGRAFVVNSHGGTLSMLDARSGRVIATIPVGISPTGAALDAYAGRVVAIATYPIGAGRISVVDARSGVVLRTVTSPDRPEAVAVDERTHHAFVLSSFGVAPVDRWAWVPAWLRAVLPWLSSSASQDQVDTTGSLTVVDLTR